MKIGIALCLVTFAVSVYGEQCKTVNDCDETSCINEDGWWLHCVNNLCLCNHDTYTGKPCADGDPATCAAVHNSRCTDHGFRWRCIDKICHCSKH
ncbi:tenascin-like [Mercenaria mercenaria]|uniref:tenascin-like n=1 Tax=Mercenaria mercenaria TaxID=6596 RepID=UPI00234F05CA|nr:tenascin-like [Mercenaria mercenaria]